jgi:VWFA-related protein
VMKPLSGRKAVVLLTDGEDRGSKVSMAEGITAAQRADTLAYSIRIWDQDAPFGGGAFGGPGMGRHGGYGAGRGGPQRDTANGKEVLQQISSQTGGAYFEVTKKEPFDEIYAKIQEDLRNQYSLGYTPDGQAQPGYRRIKVTTRKNGLIVTAREGYYSDSKAAS